MAWKPLPSFALLAVPRALPNQLSRLCFPAPAQRSSRRLLFCFPRHRNPAPRFPPQLTPPALAPGPPPASTYDIPTSRRLRVMRRSFRSAEARKRVHGESQISGRIFDATPAAGCIWTIRDCEKGTTRLVRTIARVVHNDLIRNTARVGSVRCIHCASARCRLAVCAHSRG
ncbi:hypothetical protein B0H16DRAFT_107782 [Mycena metata]|uniref:Uncharacterized protein n=1 Tax=Mycena metata TaxID=1033252 RepID=A0AAD7MY17_9AGAR|nr:hypothetical protein B0H16DRAFT_107782 [Mycena metata]